MLSSFPRLLAPALAMLALGGCGMTIDEYNHEKAQQEIAKIQAISGSYEGLLRSRDGSEAWGALRLELSAQAQISAGSGQPATTQQASLQGTATLRTPEGEVRSLIFRGGFYDPINGDFRAEVRVPQGGSQQVVLELSGNIAADTATGKIVAAGFAEQGGSFSVRKGAPPVDATQLERRRVGEPQLAHLYTGTATFADGYKSQMDLSLASPQITSEQLFADGFQPVKWVTAAIRSRQHRLAGIHFPQAQWDTRYGTLSATATGPTGSNSPNFEVTLRCQADSGSPRWNCNYFSIWDGWLFSAVFEPVGPAPSEGPRP